MLAFKLQRKEWGIIVTGLDSLPALPAKTKKSVRIESPAETIPPHAAFHDVDNSLSPRVGYAHLAASSPPVSPAGFSDNFEDIVGNVHRGRQEADARGLPDDLGISADPLEIMKSSSGAPMNPFSKTLATIEPQEKGSGELVGQSRGALVINLLRNPCSRIYLEKGV
jgi:hypothetical protein